VMIAMPPKNMFKSGKGKLLDKMMSSKFKMKTKRKK